MGVMHERSAERQQQGTTRHNDQRIREELRPAVVLDIVPSTLERREYIDERQRVYEKEYQVKTDIVPRGVIVRYLFV